MHRNLRIFMVCTLLALGCVALMAANGTTEVRVYDPEGALVTDASLAAYDDQGNLIGKYQSVAGVFSVPATVGQKLGLLVSGLTTSGKGVVFSEVVPGSETLNLTAAVGGASNDDCSGAIGVGVPSLTSGSTVGATGGDDPSGCGTANTAAGVWYSVVGTGNEITVTTCDDIYSGAGADYDTKISVFCADCDAPTCVGGNDDVACSTTFRSAVTFCSQPGVTYNILVHGFSSATGDFDLGVFESGGACEPDVQCLPEGACCTCLEPPFDCSVTDVANCQAMGGIPRGAGVQCTQGLGEPVVYTAFPGLPIVTGPITTDTITVPDSFTIGDVDIDLGISHTWIGDLSIDVEHDGVVVNIWDERCGSTINLNATADDEGLESSCAAIASGPIDSVHYSVPIAALGLLSAFDGQDSSGDWTISISDSVAFDDGVLDQWSVHLDGEQFPTCELNVNVCHHPDGGAPHTITVGESSVNHHLAHGDTVGSCEGAGGGGSGGSFNR